MSSVCCWAPRARSFPHGVPHGCCRRTERPPGSSPTARRRRCLAAVRSRNASRSRSRWWSEWRFNFNFNFKFRVRCRIPIAPRMRWNGGRRPQPDMGPRQQHDRPCVLSGVWIWRSWVDFAPDASQFGSLELILVQVQWGRPPERWTRPAVCASCTGQKARAYASSEPDT